MKSKEDAKTLLKDQFIMLSVPFKYHLERAYYPDCGRSAELAHIVLDQEFIVKKSHIGLDQVALRRIPAGTTLCFGSDPSRFRAPQHLKPFIPKKSKIKLCKNCLFILLAYSDTYIDPSLF